AKFENAAKFIKDLRHQIRQIQLVNGTCHGEKKNFIFKDLATSKQVFIRHDGPKNCLQMPYDGPYPVVSRNRKTFCIDVKGKKITVSIDRLKPAIIIADDIHEEVSSRNTKHATPESIANKEPKTEELTQETKDRKTRSGRRVHFPERLQINSY
ncbi:Integrase catalytic domain-containing protein, partial [Aphis craccivora]